MLPTEDTLPNVTKKLRHYIYECIELSLIKDYLSNVAIVSFKVGWSFLSEGGLLQDGWFYACEWKICLCSRCRSMRWRRTPTSTSWWWKALRKGSWIGAALSWWTARNRNWTMSGVTCSTRPTWSWEAWERECWVRKIKWMWFQAPFLHRVMVG